MVYLNILNEKEESINMIKLPYMSKPQTIKGKPNVIIDRNNNEVVIAFETNETGNRKLVVYPSYELEDIDKLYKFLKDFMDRACEPKNASVRYEKDEMLLNFDVKGQNQNFLKTFQGKLI